uniref:Calpain catalytic domain-containing protein n=1 Tax=Cynoglossus semilaevis TaxID=244447 RepID=A0A3P8WUI9_CYNSE
AAPPLLSKPQGKSNFGSLFNPVKFNNQDYTQLKNNHLERNCLFVDSTFPPNGCSLGDLPYLDNWEEDHLKWLRPAVNTLTFCKEGASRFNVCQGYINNSWFLAALSSLTFNQTMMNQVVPTNQSFLDYDYAGIFHFRFWRFGKWVDVVIDDFLPMTDNHLLSVFSQDGHEFWAALLEKAYAKVCGSYADMNFGSPSETCKDFSGGVSMEYLLGMGQSEGHDELWVSLSRATDSMSLICCGTPQGKDKFEKTVTSNGLVTKHTYSVTAVTEVTYLDAKVRLIRLFNPWGSQEWTGNWSDKSDLWDSVSPEDQQKRLNRSDGEFWMELKDFCQFFNILSISSENPNFIDGDVNCQWECMIYEGSWVAGKSAGGAMQVSFETNPQYRIQVTTRDEQKPGDKNLLISLIQKGSNRKYTRYYPIAVTITPEGWLELPFFYQNESLKKHNNYFINRELVELYSVEPGEYVIVHYTEVIHMAADFVLTIHTKDEAKIR